MSTYIKVPVQPEIEAKLFDRHIGQFIDATVVSDFNESILEELERWPALLEFLRPLTGTFWADRKWDWRAMYGKAKYAYPNHVVEFFAVIAEERAQGAMMVIYPKASMRMKPQQSDVLFVAKIAAAPSNRNHLIGSARRFKGVGKTLMLVAGARSYELGLNGYVSLLSVSNQHSVDFYTHEMKMMSFAEEVDDEEGMIYFENVISEGYIKSD